MANSDSFINEVTEEVRRDRLFAIMRRWGWLAALVVIVLVGGAALLEYRRAQERARAEAFGDAVITALDAADPAARIAGLDALAPPGPEGEVLLALLAAAEASGSDRAADAATRLRAAAEGADLPRRYRDLAVLKAEMIDPSAPDEARLILDALAEPGAPYAPLAEEQLALMEIRDGDPEAGLERLRSIERSAAATAGLQQRASRLIVALEAGATLVDSLPGPEAAAGDGGMPADDGEAEGGAEAEDDGAGAEDGAEEDGGAGAADDGSALAEE